MKLQGAVVREGGVSFAIVVVKRHILNNRTEAGRTASALGSAFPGLPIVLMGQDTGGRATYFGRPDIVRYLSNVPVRAIPWREYSLN